MRVLITGILLAALSFGCANAQSQQPAPDHRINESKRPQDETASSQKKPDQKQTDPQQSPPITKINPSLHAQKEASNGGDKHPQKSIIDWPLSDKIAVFATIAAILQFLALVATVLVMRESAQRQLRAYLVLDQASVTKLIAGQPAMIHIVIKNTGQTPAYDISGYTVIMYDKFPLLRKFPAIDTALVEEQRSVLGSGGIIHTHTSTKHSPVDETIQSIIIGTTALYIWGEYNYRDAFRRKRFTKFRLYFTKPIEGINMLRPLGKEGNEAN